MLDIVLFGTGMFAIQEVTAVLLFYFSIIVDKVLFGLLASSKAYLVQSCLCEVIKLRIVSSVLVWG